MISAETTGNSIDRKLKRKLRRGREELPGDTRLILAVYLEEQIAQGFQIEQWLNEGYYDVGEFCDAWLRFTHLGETEMEYQSFTDDGQRCRAVYDRMFNE